MLMGEYAVTQVGHPGVVMAIDRFLTCTVEPYPQYLLEFPDLNVPPMRANDWHALGEQMTRVPRLDLISHVLTLAARYLEEERMSVPTFHLTVRSELQNEAGVKYGLGSSAAVSVAVAAGFLSYALRHPVPRDPIFKLAAAAHVLSQGNGSCADIAAACYGGLLRYERFDADWLNDRLGGGGSLHALVQSAWPWLHIQRLPKGPELCLKIGWTGEPASTPALLQRMATFQAQYPERFKKFVGESDEAVELFIDAMQASNGRALLEAVKANRTALQRLGLEAQVPIETDAIQRGLSTVAQLGGAGKSSGAGGGDAILAWFFAPEPAEQLRKQWREDGILLLPVSSSDQGVSIEP